ncbi:MAG: 4-(cytidine 5'-diphospho)-2-C-methyl-D-erythritol kinase [Alphaproteobacteria bacterium]|nr:4-(cytidine 5'-diphospho)-2-C-methyl-D-erythritol kinase [Alphaproteobacteria bacterium]
MLSSLAPAKVNLFLHVGAPTADGFHPICSLMAFADVGDVVRLDPFGQGFFVEGAFAEGLTGEGDNLVARARRTLSARTGREGFFGLILEKRLPIAAGLGGGSSDAAAALRLMRAYLGLTLDAEALREMAKDLGSDTPACVEPRPMIAEGRGERLRPPPAFPDLPVVLVNPRAPSPTGPVYRAYDLAVAPQGANAPVWPDRFSSVRDMAGALELCRNDLEAPALALTPVIGEVLDALRAAPEPLLVRMSGSGATCFALCETPQSAKALAARLHRAHPDWWIADGRIGGVR